jgi:toluene monooxygenase system protein E
MPTEYEIATTRLLPHAQRGCFEVRASMDAWYAKYQRGSRLAGLELERFVDPERTTYTSYVARQRAAEAYLDGLARAIDERAYDASLHPAWIDRLDRLLPVVRFPLHGLQMLAAYVGQMAPSSRVVVAAAFQAADEVRRIQRIARRSAQLRSVRPAFGQESRAVWEGDPAWQPLRAVVENALVAFDWGEALVVLNVCLGPALDALLSALGEAGLAQGDPWLGAFFASFEADARWHREWTRAIVTLAGDRARDALEEWAAAWTPRASDAIAPLAPLLGGDAVERALARLLRARQVVGLGGEP